MRRMKMFGLNNQSDHSAQTQQAAAKAAAASEPPKREPLAMAASYFNISEKYLLPAANNPLTPLSSIEEFVLGVEAAQKAAEIYKKEKKWEELNKAAALLNAAGIILQTEAQKYGEYVKQNKAPRNASGCLIPHPPASR